MRVSPLTQLRLWSGACRTEPSQPSPPLGGRGRGEGGVAAVVISALLCLAPAVLAQDGETIVAHGLSAFGDLKYAADFTHFDYVNPDAPKGGKLSTLPTSGMTTFDSFNGFILKGDSVEGVTFSQAQGFGGIQPASLTFDSLMVKSGDEPDSVYGLVAYEAEYPNDRSWVIFRMRPEARFQDGSPLTAEDVVFTFDMFKEQGHPILRQLLRDVVGAEALGPHEVKFTFAENVMTRDLPMLVAELAIQSKAYYATRQFDT